jgi:cytidylate kinase
MIITIDGPAGSGKSTAARRLAARLGIAYLDTGAMYRVVTLAALEAGIDLSDEEARARVAADADFELDCGPTQVQVTLGGRDVTEAIRSVRVNEHTRFIASSPGVRRVLVEKQQELGRRMGSMVTEGRDQGTVVFPEADFKFFIDADAATRAERRLRELLAEGEPATLEEVSANLAERDRTDAERDVGPLTVPKDAIIIDTSALSIAEMIDRLLAALRRGGVEIPPRNAAHSARRSP